MVEQFEARYLQIEWISEGVARTIEIAPNLLEVEPDDEGTLVIESTIFNDLHPWVGIRLGHELGQVTPVFVTPSGRERPLLRVEDPQGSGAWWLCNDGWDLAGKRHVSDLQRSAGTYTILIGEVTVQLHNRMSGLGRDDIQAYIDDFRGDLLWIVMNDIAAATAAGSGVGMGSELIEALTELHVASHRVQASPAVAIREGQALRPLSKLTPTAATFRDYARNPAARHLTGRVFSESADIAENRYVRHMLAVSQEIARAYVFAARRQLHFLDRIASEERSRASHNRDMQFRQVDPQVFDAQTQEIEQRLQALLRFDADADGDSGQSRAFPLRLGKTYHEPLSFFYQPQEGAGRAPDTDIDYRIVVLPNQAFEPILRTLHFCKDFTIKGRARSEVGKTRRGKQFLRLVFDSVVAIEPQTDVLEKRRNKKNYLEQSDWYVALTDTEKRELRREAEASDHRADQARQRHDVVASSSAEVERRIGKLIETDARLERLGVSRSSAFPLGMRFVSNPDYIACIGAFNTIRAYLNKSGLDAAKLEEVNNVGILHVSDIYEKWCLVKILMLLVQDFLFEPEFGWEEKLISASLTQAINVVFTLSRRSPDLKIVLTWQAQTSTGRRPDFVLRLVDPPGQRFQQAEQDQDGSIGVVMDAKFRRAWKPGDLRDTLNELVLKKGYDEVVEGGRVFILQPCESTVVHPSSPLEWGAHCDYGSAHSHRRGWIQLGVALSGARSTQHLKRLLTMVFQHAFPAPQEGFGTAEGSWTSRSFCIGCGQQHDIDAIRAKQTKSGAMRWLLDCKACRTWTVRTHCYECRKPLFKNGTLWTYHNTLADQVTNVMCPHCGAYFDGVSF